MWINILSGGGIPAKKLHNRFQNEEGKSINIAGEEK